MSEEPKRSEQETSINMKSLTSQLVNVEKVHINVSEEVIIVTEDKLRLCLIKYLQNLGKKRAWISPLGIFLTIIVALGTTTFRDIVIGENMSISANTWQAIFIIASILSFGWLCFSIAQALKTKKIEDVVKELKKLA